MAVSRLPDAVVSKAERTGVGDRAYRRRALGPEAAERLLSDSYFPVRVLPQGAPEEFVMETAEARIGRVTAAVISINAAARIITAETDHVRVMMTLRGRSVWYGNAEDAIVARSGDGVVLNAEQAADTWLSDGCACLCVMVPQEALHQELEALSGRPLGSPLRFTPRLRLKDGSSGLLAPALRLLVTGLHDADSAFRLPRVGRHVEGLVLDGLLLGHQHNHSSLLDRPTRAGKSPVARAVELLEEHPELPWTTVALAHDVHLSVRALQEGFRREHDLTPMAYLRAARLREVHRDLADAVPGSIRVRDVALRYGFVHLGRFAAAYRQQFGEKPSTTLARVP
ncbi:AraC-like DNA-binding protein [Nocardioides sp. HB32]